MANTENIRKWVAALRSDEFEQGKSQLAAEGKYCCLGVACELAVKDGLPVEVKTSCCEHCDKRSIIRYDEESAILPASVRDWLGLDERDPHATYKGERHKLSKLNDDGAFNFNDIADIIERTFIAGDSDAWYDKELVAA